MTGPGPARPRRPGDSLPCGLPDGRAGRMGRSRLNLIALLLAPWVLASAPGEVARAPLASPVDVPLVPYVGRLLTLDAMAGTEPVRLIFDTGGGETILSPRIAARLGCTPSGRSIGYRMSGERIALAFCADVTLTIGGVPFPHPEIGVWDVGAILPAGVPPVDGVVSLKTFAAQPFTLRLAERRLTLETGRSLGRQTAGMTRLRSRLATGTDGDELALFVRGAVNDPAWFLVDSGNLDVVQVGTHVRGAPPGAGETWDAELTLEGLPGARTTFRTRDLIYDGVLSEEFLRRWTLAIDLSGNAVWAAPIATPSGAATPSPVAADTQPARHLIYLHGRIVQDQQSARPQSPKFGAYELDAILDTFRDRGFVVRGDIRPKSDSVGTAADRVVQQVGRLIASGVAADHITVVGASMGASIALLAATRLQNPAVRFAILGACLSAEVRALVANEGKAPRGQMLAIRESSDDLTEPCPGWTPGAGDATPPMPPTPDLAVREIVVDTGLGHGFLYRPLPEWVEPVVAWANAAGRAAKTGPGSGRSGA